jgi:glutathione synthase/RimK-type ligase-like ATP-grasp enzyme
MWLKFEVITSDLEIIYLPSTLSELINQDASIKFGGGDPISAAVLFSDEIELSEGNTYKNPGRIRISNKLRDKLFLPESLIYQVKISNSCILVGPVIGLLMGIHTHRYNPKHMQKYSDRLGVYNQVGGLLYAFSPKSINWIKHMAYGLFYNIATAKWEYGCFPLPEVIYRRDFHSNPAYIKKLMEYTDGRLFNSYRFTKMDLYNYLSPDKGLKKYLPQTELSCNFEQVRKFIDLYQQVILKPIDLSRGRGICIIEKIDLIYKITDYRSKYPATSILYDYGSLERFFALNQNFFDRYLIQQYLDLAKIGNSFFDIRVVMQKHKGQVWGCTGIECRVSEHSHLTNISRGGYALTLDEALRKSFVKDCKTLTFKIDEFCQNLCLHMDQMGHHFAEFGLDIAIDIDQNIWLIEANVFPSFRGFKKIDRQTYLSIRYTPLLYALSLTEFGE